MHLHVKDPSVLIARGCEGKLKLLFECFDILDTLIWTSEEYQAPARYKVISTARSSDLCTGIADILRMSLTCQKLAHFLAIF